MQPNNCLTMKRVNRHPINIMVMASPRKSAMSAIYMDVVVDVIQSMRDVFMEDGVDECVLEDLRQLWREKIMTASGGPEKEEPAPQPQPAVRYMPIQVKLPASEGKPARHLVVNVPAECLQNNQLQQILTGQVISAALNLPVDVASQMLQDHINRSVSKLAQVDGANDVSDNDFTQISSFTSTNPLPATTDNNQTAAVTLAPNPLSLEVINLHKVKRPNKLVQQDGTDDTSDSEEDSVDLVDEEGLDVECQGPEEQPLNSDDDITDDEVVDMSTDNVIVCQYDKINRSRNKWKLFLKDGIVHTKGTEFAFHKAMGDAEW